MYSLETELLAIKIACIPKSDEAIQKYKELNELIDKYSKKNDIYTNNIHETKENKIIILNNVYHALLDIVDFLNDNREILHPIRSLNLFTTVDLLLTNWKYITKELDLILYLRKCINWIRRTY